MTSGSCADAFEFDAAHGFGPAKTFLRVEYFQIGQSAFAVVISGDAFSQMFRRDRGLAKYNAQRVHLWVVADFRNRLGREKSLNRDVFVHVVPVDSNAPADESPVGALFGRGTK